MKGPVFIAGRLFLHGRRDRRQGRPLFGAALGIALSLVPLVVVDHIADAMIEGIIGRYRETSSYHFQVHTWGTEEREIWENLAAELKNRDGVESAWVERQGFGLGRASGPREGLTLRAVPENADEIDSSFAGYIEFDEGSWNLTGDSILLGREAARRLEAVNGDELLVLTAKRMPNGRYVPRVSRLTVNGIFTSGYQDLDRTWAFISTSLGWEILSEESSRTFVGGKYTSLNRDIEYSNNLRLSLADQWTFHDWRELNRYLLGNLESTRSILLFIMALIILVAVFNVMTSIVMLTLERRREIGILKCTGTSPRDLTITFVTAGALAALVGTVFGLGGGLLVAYFINPIISGIEAILGFVASVFGDAPAPSLLNENYYLQQIPVVIRWPATAAIGLTTLILSIFAGWIPSYRASRLRPLDVLRKH